VGRQRGAQEQGVQLPERRRELLALSLECGDPLVITDVLRRLADVPYLLT
jgi:hypothetical protein